MGTLGGGRLTIAMIISNNSTNLLGPGSVWDKVPATIFDGYEIW